MTPLDLSWNLKCLVGPITALSVNNGKIISGCGGELSVFDLATSKLQAVTHVFTGSVIHGIKAGKTLGEGTLLCVFGAKQACVVSLACSEPKDDCISLSKFKEIKTLDWIWDAHWLSQQVDASYVCLALAHNSAVLWDWSTDRIKKITECREKCILYSAHFIGNTWENMIFAAGTVFNQVVLWPVGDSLEEDECSNKQDTDVDIMHTFSGHKGVIFSIDYNDTLGRLCSASDDRSIRLWQLAFPTSNNESPTIADWRKMESHLMFCLFGHAARVWDVTLMSNSFVSVGEDATCIVWDYKGNVVQKFKGHKGKSIWSMAASPDERQIITGGGDASIRVWNLEDSKQVQSSSAVLPIQLICGEDDFPRTVRLLSFDTILIMMNSGSLYTYTTMNQKFKLVFSDPDFKSYSVVSPCLNETLCAIGTITGKIRIVKIQDKSDTVENHVDKALFDGKVLSLVWLDSQLLLCCGPCGYCVLLGISDCGSLSDSSTELIVSVRHGFSLPPSKHCWVSGACVIRGVDGQMEYLVFGDKDGSVFLYSAEDPSTVEDELSKPLQTFYRVHGKTGVTFVCERNGHIYTTGRDGFYREWELQDGQLVQLHGHKVLKGLDWIDRLEWHNGELCVYGFFSTQFVVWNVALNQQLVSVQCGGGHRAWACLFQDGLSRFVYLKSGAVRMVETGYHYQQLMVSPPLHGREVCDVKFIPWSNGSLIPVSCTASEDTSINVGAFIDNGCHTVWKPLATLKGHLSSVRAVTFCSNKHNLKSGSSDSSGVLFSGGGRAEVRAWRLSMTDPADTMTSNGKNSEINAEKDHRKKFMQKHDLSPSKQSCSSGISQHNLKDDQLSNLKSTVPLCHYEHLCTHFLGESRHKQKYGSWKTRKLRLDPETRVMSLAASLISDFILESDLEREKDKDSSPQDSSLDKLQPQYIISVAGSDGHLRMLSFDDQARRFLTLASTFHHLSCVLKVIHYSHQTVQNQRQLFALSASTQGDIVLWNLSFFIERNFSRACENTIEKIHGQSETDVEEEEDFIDLTQSATADPEHNKGMKESMQPVLSVQTHQSGINSLHVLQISETTALIASGGDDNAIAVQKVELVGLQASVVAKGTKVDAHAAQVTGIWAVSQTLVVSASIDQRVCVWQLDSCDGEIKIQMVGCKYIEIADISCLDAFLIGDSVCLCICGEGICLLKFDVKDMNTSKWQRMQ